MKRLIIYISFSFLLLIGILLLYSYLPGTEHNTSRTNLQSNAPGRLTEIGPYGKNISFTEQIDICSINMKAKRMYVTKTKLMGFDSALRKNLVAEDLYLTIYKDNKKLLSLYKDRQIMSLNMKLIEIKNPEILYPQDIKQLDKVIVDKEKHQITFFHGDNTDKWDLAIM